MINSTVLVELFDISNKSKEWAVQQLAESISSRGFVVRESSHDINFAKIVFGCTDRFITPSLPEFEAMLTVDRKSQTFCIECKINGIGEAFKTKAANQATSYIEMLYEHLQNIAADIITEEQTFVSGGENDDISWREKYNSLLDSSTGDNSAQRLLSFMLTKYKRDGSHVFHIDELKAGLDNPNDVLTRLSKEGFISIGTGVRETDVVLDRTAADSIAQILGL
jgi:hypothetical protein